MLITSIYLNKLFYLIQIHSDLSIISLLYIHLFLFYSIYLYISLEVNQLTFMIQRTILVVCLPTSPQWLEQRHSPNPHNSLTSIILGLCHRHFLLSLLKFWVRLRTLISIIGIFSRRSFLVVILSHTSYTTLNWLMTKLTPAHPTAFYSINEQKRLKSKLFLKKQTLLLIFFHVLNTRRMYYEYASCTTSCNISCTKQVTICF